MASLLLQLRGAFSSSETLAGPLSHGYRLLVIRNGGGRGDASFACCKARGRAVEGSHFRMVLISDHV